MGLLQLFPDYNPVESSQKVVYVSTLGLVLGLEEDKLREFKRVIVKGEVDVFELNNLIDQVLTGQLKSQFELITLLYLLCNDDEKKEKLRVLVSASSAC